MVMVLLAQVAETPGGKPLTPSTPSSDIPVAAPFVVWVIAAIGVFIQTEGCEDGGPADWKLVTVIVTLAVAEQPASVTVTV